MKTELELLSSELAIFAKKMQKAGIDIKTIKKPINAGTSIGLTHTPIITL